VKINLDLTILFYGMLLSHKESLNGVLIAYDCLLMQPTFFGATQY